MREVSRKVTAEPAQTGALVNGTLSVTQGPGRRSGHELTCLGNGPISSHQVADSPLRRGGDGPGPLRGSSGGNLANRSDWPQTLVERQGCFEATGGCLVQGW